MLKKVLEDNLISAVGQSHPISNNPSIKEFVSYPHMLISNLNLHTGKIVNVYNKGIVDYVLDKEGLKREVTVVVPHFSSAPNLLNSSSLILTAPSRLIEFYRETYQLKTFKTPIKERLYSELFVAWNKTSLEKRGNVWFESEIIDKISL